MKSYLDGRTQCVQIEGVISEFSELACGVPQWSVLGPLKLCIYMLPIGSIMRHHNIDFHIYADNTHQLYVSFDWSNPNVALDRINLGISDFRIWMIRNKLKINDSKTEFLIITSSFLNQSFDDLNIMVGDSNIIFFLIVHVSLISILVVFVNQLIFICVTLVAFVVFYLMMHAHC